MKAFLLTSAVILSIIALSCIIYSPPTSNDTTTPEQQKEKATEENCGTVDKDLQNELQKLQEELALLQHELIESSNEVKALQNSLLAEKNIWKTEWPRRNGRSIILYLSIPGSGEDLIRQAISQITGSPTYSLYSEELQPEDGEINFDLSAIPLWKSCNGNDHCTLSSNFPVLIKSYLPVVTKQSNVPPFQKAIKIIRNPFDSIKSFYDVCQSTSWLASRRRSWDNHVKKELAEYKKFHDYWDRYQTDSDISFLTIRFEDICENPFSTFLNIFAFLDILSYYDESNLVSFVNSEEFQNTFCMPPLSLSTDNFSDTQKETISSELSKIIGKYSYTNLVDQFLNM